MLDAEFIHALADKLDRNRTPQVVQPVFIPADEANNIRAHVAYLSPDGTPCVMPVRDDQRLRPERISASQTFIHANSFASYVGDFKDIGTRIFGSLARAKFVCELDYHRPGAPSHCTHAATLDLQYTPEWSLWVDLEKAGYISQVDLVDFLEQLDHTIIEPDAASIRTIITNLAFTKDYELESKYDPESGGVRISYRDEHQQGGSFKIPSRIYVAMAPYRGMDPQQLEVRVHYRVNGSKVVFALYLHNRAKALEEAFMTVASELEELTGITPEICP